MKRNALSAALVMLLAMACNLEGAVKQNTPTSATDFNPDKLGSVDKDLTYCVVDGVELKMDIYYPETDEGLWSAAV